MGGFSYRADIDGVRAVAVMGVILAHAGLGAPGGFLGVDIFFVISGYLITTILLRDLEAGRYTLRGFYERRARRILPALVLVIACCVPFAVWLLLPDFLENFGQSVFATLFFSNNILLAATSGYWEIESAFKPLLHTWSLGVEEQFYIVFPLLLAFLWRFGRRVQIVTLAVAALVSFALAEHGWRTYPEASFYLPTSRAWELLAGCLIAYLPRKPRGSDQAVTLACLPALILPLVLFDEHTPSPSVYSAIPVLATAGLILFNRPETLAFKVLALRPLVFIGLISYSAYLWHQPVFAFVAYRQLRAARPGDDGGADRRHAGAGGAVLVVRRAAVPRPGGDAAAAVRAAGRERHGPARRRRAGAAFQPRLPALDLSQHRRRGRRLHRLQRTHPAVFRGELPRQRAAQRAADRHQLWPGHRQRDDRGGSA